jgi:hypothetical protein
MDELLDVEHEYNPSNRPGASKGCTYTDNFPKTKRNISLLRGIENL